jgi:GH24 family phage-related lysozyme (muramidase)
MKLKLIILFFLTCLFASAHQISPNGQKFIKEHEGLLLVVDNHRQIGYGHLLKKGETYKRISKEKAEQLFVQDIAAVNKSVDRLLSKLPSKIKYSQGFIDGLGSLVYNCGEYGVARSTFYHRLLNCRTVNDSTFKQEDLDYALAAVKTLKCPLRGHKIRRAREYQLMRNGKYEKD